MLGDSTNPPPGERVRITSNMRKQASLADFTGEEAGYYLMSLDEADQLAGFCIVQWQGTWLDYESHKGDARHLDKLRDRYLLKGRPLDRLFSFLLLPRTPFEHYQAIEAIWGISTYLSLEQRQELCMRVMNSDSAPWGTSERWPMFVDYLKNLCSSGEST